ncbi:hypothetical protein AQUCO_06600024v1 [Aquilegia coerulea]|uniref:FBD domain-containing protein n=1 Tax=Aquilegia coerulea TaxID=218851 RepID=A0A2G5CDA8_AQUCA|nr:hypothetical protein AQUCO_06600024v1 [Aquilegia coerulea]
MPDSIDLPSLRNLSLRSIDCLSDEFLDLYFNGCPLLESLSFIACDFLEEENVTFSAPQLKHLVIDTFNKGSDTPYNCKILVSAPNLISFQCCDYTSHEYCLENLSSLEVARFNMIVEEEYNEELDMFAPVYTKEDGRFMINCLKGISNVKSLTLNHHFLLVVAEAPDVLRMSPIPFRNLRFLKLDTWMGKAYIRAVMYILENSRDIETLVIEFSRVSFIFSWPCLFAPEFFQKQFLETFFSILRCLVCLIISIVNLIKLENSSAFKPGFEKS